MAARLWKVRFRDTFHRLPPSPLFSDSRDCRSHGNPLAVRCMHAYAREEQRASQPRAVRTGYDARSEVVQALFPPSERSEGTASRSGLAYPIIVATLRIFNRARSRARQRSRCLHDVNAREISLNIRSDSIEFIVSFISQTISDFCCEAPSFHAPFHWNDYI